MGVRFPSVQSNTILNSPVVTTAETVVCTTPAFSPAIDFSTILLLAMAAFTTTGGTTAVTARLRRGTTVAGALVQTAAFILQVGATLANSLMLWYFDSPGAIGGQQYSLTLQYTAAAANTTINDVAMLAFAL